MHRPIVALVASTLLAAAPAAAGVHTFTGEGGTVPEQGPADPAKIVVEGIEGRVTSLVVRLHGFSHNYTGEVGIALSNPDGIATLLWNGGRCSTSRVDLVFDDAAPGGFSDACDSGYISSGRYKVGPHYEEREFTIPIAPLPPYETSLGALLGGEVNGRWILWAEDFVNGDGATYAGWEIEITTEE